MSTRAADGSTSPLPSPTRSPLLTPTRADTLRAGLASAGDTLIKGGKSMIARVLGIWQGMHDLMNSADNRDRTAKFAAAASNLAGNKEAATFFGNGRLAFSFLNVFMSLRSSAASFSRSVRILSSLGSDEPAEVWMDHKSKKDMQVQVTYTGTATKLAAFAFEFINALRWLAFSICMGICAPAIVADKYIYKGSSKTAKDIGGQFALFSACKDGGALLASGLECVLRGVEYRNVREETVNQATRVYNPTTQTWTDGPREQVVVSQRKAWKNFVEAAKKLALDTLEKGGETVNHIIRLGGFKVDPRVIAGIAVFSSGVGMLRMLTKKDWRVGDLSSL